MAAEENSKAQKEKSESIILRDGTIYFPKHGLIFGRTKETPEIVREITEGLARRGGK